VVKDLDEDRGSDLEPQKENLLGWNSWTLERSVASWVAGL